MHLITKCKAKRYVECDEIIEGGKNPKTTEESL